VEKEDTLVAEHDWLLGLVDLFGLDFQYFLLLLLLQLFQVLNELFVFEHVVLTAV